MKLSVTRNLLILLFHFHCVEIFGTIFLPVPLKNQLNESYGVVHGNFIGKTYKILKTSGQVVTVASFHVIGSVGIRRNEMINNNEFKVMYPGGSWQGIEYNFHGSPSFDDGEEVVLMINKNSEGLWIQNLGLGKYKVIKDSKGNNRLSSSVFPGHPRLGRIEWEHFNILLHDRFGEKLSNKKSDKIIHKENPFNGPKKDLNIVKVSDRKLASSAAKKYDQQEEVENNNEEWIFYLSLTIFLSFIFIVIFKFLVSKGSEDDN